MTKQDQAKKNEKPMMALEKHLFLRLNGDNAPVKTTPTADNAIALANKLRIHPAIVAGWVCYETNNWRILNNLKGEVRKIFENQLGCLHAHTS